MHINNEITEEIYNDLELLPEDLRGWNSAAPAFKFLIEKQMPNLIIEVGSWKGASAIHMAKIAKSLELKTKIWCVDTWLGAEEFWGNLSDTGERDLLLKNGYPQIYYQFLSNVVHNDCQDVILPFPNTSSIGAVYFKKKKIKSKLIYIDASHETHDVYWDLKHYYEILEHGGIIFGDDLTWSSVRVAVNRFCTEMKVAYKPHGKNHWYIEKS